MLQDSQYLHSAPYHHPEIDHDLGPQFHLLHDPYLFTHLATLCTESTNQPLANRLIEKLYERLFTIAINQEFPKIKTLIHSRMETTHPEGAFQANIIDPATKAVTVNLARAGTYPSHVGYDLLNYLLIPANVRQDHVSIARQTDANHQVTHSEVAGHKIGGPIEDAHLFIPDPMGATGSTVLQAIDLYERQGRPKKIIALHVIITPEYVRALKAHHPEVKVYAIRYDRGLSSAKTLQTRPGHHLELEKGLNDRQYIVPGGGGFGEVLNNSFV
jgi:uracil phosphoribosyltransferase